MKIHYRNSYQRHKNSIDRPTSSISIQTMNAANNSQTATSTSPVTKSVSFSPTLMEIHLVRYPDDLDVNELWFSREDNGRSIHAVLRDVAGLSTVMAADTLNNPSDAVSKENVIKCVGLEHLVVARSVPRRLRAIRAERSEHVQAVLQAQQTKEDISHTSKVSSSRACSKARFIAQVAASAST
jgi:hypothetical protein